MGNHWFVYKKHKPKGPYTWEQLWREAQAGKISPKDLVWNKNMKDWIKAAQVPGLISNHRKRNYLRIAVVASAAFFFVLSGTAFYYLFFYTGPQLAAIDEQDESELIEEASPNDELEEPGSDNQFAFNNSDQSNENQNENTTSVSDPNDGDQIETDPPASAEETIAFQGGTYTGPLKDGQPHGYGTWVHPDGRQYEGDFENGSIDGYGSMTFPSGERYTGYFADGKAHGEGTMVHPDGRRVSGTWVEGIFQGEQHEDSEEDPENVDDEADDNED